MSAKQRRRYTTPSAKDLFDSQMRLQATALETAANGILITDARGTILWVNSSFAALAGYSTDELLGSNPRLLRSGLHDPEFYEGLWDTILSGQSWHGEFTNRRKDGTIFYTEQTITPVRDEAGRISHFVGIMTDITEKKRVQTALRESETRYKQLFEHATYGIFRSKPDGTIVDANPALVSMLRYQSRDEVLALNLNNDVYVKAADRAAILAYFETPNPKRQFEAIWKRADGQTIYVRLSGRRIDDANGTPTHYDVVVEDITDRHQLEEKLAHAAKMEGVGRLAGGVAHDFNNLMGVILGFGDLLLLESGLSERARKSVEEMRRAANRAVEVTRQLLAFSRKQVLESRILSLNDMVQETGKMLRRLIGEDVALKTFLQPDLAAISADPTQLDQILLNLAVNARDAMPGGGTLTIETKNVSIGSGSDVTHGEMPAGDYVMLAVSDTGTGMDSETKKHIFEPFFTTKKERGTGLGLSTVYGIVKQSGGYIWVYSEVGVGTTFKIYLPSIAVGCAVNSSRPEIVERANRGDETILLVEDDNALRSLSEEMLRGLGYMVVSAGNPCDAISIAERLQAAIDLVISDVILPGMNGGQLVNELLKMRPSLKVLFVSGYTDNVIQKAVTAGAAFLQKPFSRDSLGKKVREVLATGGARDAGTGTLNAGGVV